LFPDTAEYNEKLKTWILTTTFQFFRQFFVNVMIGSSGEKMSQPFSDVIGRADTSQARSKMNSNEQSADRGRSN
jgi:hypothetical protein